MVSCMYFKRALLATFIVCTMLCAALYVGHSYYSTPEIVIKPDLPKSSFPNSFDINGQRQVFDIVDNQIPTARLQLDAITSYYMQLNDEHKKVYDFIYKSVSELKTGYLDVVVATGQPVVASEFSDIMTYVSLDHPELYWFPTTFAYQYDSDDSMHVHKVSFTDAYLFHNLGQWSDIVDAGFTSAVNEAYEAIPNGDNATKAEWIAKFLINSASYDNDEANYKLEQSAYSVFCTDKTICGGWSRAYKLLCDKANIPCSILFLPIKDYNDKEFYHAFNIVSVDDREICVDLTNAFTISNNLSYDEYVQMLAKHGWYANEEN